MRSKKLFKPMLSGSFYHPIGLNSDMKSISNG